MKRILAINDLTVRSKAAISISSNIIPLFGFELDILPTMLYSNHLGFKEVAKLDTSTFIKDTLAIYANDNFYYDYIYLGLLLNKENINTILKYIKPNTIIYFDPIMGDNGRLYNSIDVNYPNYIKELIYKSEVITPNLFEACLILNKEYKPNLNELEIKNILKELSSLGPKIVIITSVTLNNLYGAYLYDKQNNEYYFYGLPKLDYNAHGTGDLFSSLFMGYNLTLNDSKLALCKTIDILYEILKYNQKSNENVFKNGLDYERFLPKIIYDSKRD